MSSRSLRPAWFVPVLALILFCSGACALVYQTVWLREFRLIFGGSAPAAAAVLAVFMGGLGLGSWWFGRRIERVTQPFRFYVGLEVAVSLTAMATPYLLTAVRSLYILTGGVQALGSTLATIVQILITVVVLGPSCFLMGGTLPAAMKFAQRDDDPRRSITAFFYAINVAGAVAGAAVSTFWLLGTAGNRGTLAIAGLVNAMLAGMAWFISQSCERKGGSEAPTVAGVLESSEAAALHRRAPVAFVLAGTFVSGFTFFLIELLWYRLSAPLLGGSVYSLGLVLCVALAGMGIGSFGYSLRLRHREPSLEAFVLISALQAVAVILPAVLGDHFAFGALVINYITHGFGFGALLGGWTVIVMAMAFLPSLLAGVQFPLLVALLGRGNAGVGRELGRAYLCNTAGAILGCLLGGFVLIPWLGLRDCWYAVAGLIGFMPVIGLVVLNRQRCVQTVPMRQMPLRLAFATLAAGVIMAVYARGPTSVWLHFPIGYGRTTVLPNTPEKLEEWKRTIRRSHVQSFDGRETSVAVMSNDEYILLTNGKADGSALGDAATQVMLGLTGAALHPNPKRACVIGLGTGTTVGWLADVPSIEHVDAIEIEEHMQDLAKLFAPVNRNAMNHPKVRHMIGDAREFLVTKGDNYDLIVSEPSNPYRAGVASLYTREFYHSVHERLNPEGILCQWVQGYEALPETVDAVIATLGKEFPKVELWNTMQNDLLLVASMSDKPWNTDQLRDRIKYEPFTTALRQQWYTDTAEGFFAHCLANQDFTRAVATSRVPTNTDDLNLLEFGYARSIGKVFSGNALAYRQGAYKRDQMLPKLSGPPLEEEQLGRELLSCLWSSLHRVERFAPRRGSPPPPSVVRMTEAFEANAEKHRETFEHICAEVPLKTLQERWLLTVDRAVHGDPEAVPLMAQLEPLYPEDTALLHAAYSYAREDFPTTRRAFISACTLLHQSPWSTPALLIAALELAEPLSGKGTHAAPEDGKAIFQVLREPFLVGNEDDTRLTALAGVSGHLDDVTRLDMIAAWGPNFPWRGLPLALRAGTFLSTHDFRQGLAMEELQEFVEGGGELPRPKVDAVPSTTKKALPP